MGRALPHLAASALRSAHPDPHHRALLQLPALRRAGLGEGRMSRPPLTGRRSGFLKPVPRLETSSRAEPFPQGECMTEPTPSVTAGRTSLPPSDFPARYHNDTPLT